MTIESQDDTNPKYCTDRTNQTLYLVDRIEELSMPRCDIVRLQKQIDRLEKQLKIAESWFREIGNSVDTYFKKDNRPLEFTLDVLTACGLSAHQALHEIKELDK